MLNLSMTETEHNLRPRIVVMGVGGAGGNAINNMINSGLAGCEFIAANTDSQALAGSLAQSRIQLGVHQSRGLGAGSKPEIGRAAAEEQIEDLLAHLEEADMLFVTAGMGGGTGTGAAPVIAKAAKEQGILTVGVVTKPFNFEGPHRMRQAEAGIAELQQYVDTLIVIPNQNLFRIANEKTTFADAFRLADNVLLSGVRGITDLMVMPGFMNLDFADVKTVMSEMGKAMMGTGEADGENRAIRAAEQAITNPLLDDSMRGARGVLINITGGLDMTLFEVDEAANRIREQVDPDAQIKVGSTLDNELNGKLRVSIIATGIDIDNQTQNAGSGVQKIQTPQTSSAPHVNDPATEGRTQNAGAFKMPPAINPQAVPQNQYRAQAAAPAPTQIKTPVANPISPTAYNAPRIMSEPAARQAPQEPAYQPPPISRTPIHPPQNAVQPKMNVEEQRTQRTQELFTRITGFGIKRPSSQQDAPDHGFEADTFTSQAMESGTTGISPQDKPVISDDANDMLNIPAFLRRQNTH